MKIIPEKICNKPMLSADHNYGLGEEVMVFCPSCKTLQTVWLAGDNLLTTVKFTQTGNHIYHNCGTNQPCKLFCDHKEPAV